MHIQVLFNYKYSEQTYILLNQVFYARYKTMRIDAFAIAIATILGHNTPGVKMQIIRL